MSRVHSLLTSHSCSIDHTIENSIKMPYGNLNSLRLTVEKEDKNWYENYWLFWLSLNLDVLFLRFSNYLIKLCFHPYYVYVYFHYLMPPLLVFYFAHHFFFFKLLRLLFHYLMPPLLVFYFAHHFFFFKLLRLLFLLTLWSYFFLLNFSVIFNFDFSIFFHLSNCISMMEYENLCFGKIC